MMKTVADDLGVLDIELHEPTWRWSSVMLLCRTCAFTPQTSEERPVRRHEEPIIAQWQRDSMPPGSRRIKYARGSSAILVPFSSLLPFKSVRAHLLHEVYPTWDGTWMDRAVYVHSYISPNFKTEPI